jgi:hypothetical protein
MEEVSPEKAYTLGNHELVLIRVALELPTFIGELAGG